LDFVIRVICFSQGNGRFIKLGRELQIITQHDAEGTEGQNGNKSWFFFSVDGTTPGESVTMKAICAVRYASVTLL